MSQVRRARCAGSGGNHALTMARMDRLFGVTMTERGVSQLVSVSLAEAERVVAA